MENSSNSDALAFSAPVDTESFPAANTAAKAAKREKQSAAKKPKPAPEARLIVESSLGLVTALSSSSVPANAGHGVVRRPAAAKKAAPISHAAAKDAGSHGTIPESTRPVQCTASSFTSSTPLSAVGGGPSRLATTDRSVCLAPPTSLQSPPQTRVVSAAAAPADDTLLPPPVVAAACATDAVHSANDGCACRLALEQQLLTANPTAFQTYQLTLQWMRVAQEALSVLRHDMCGGSVATMSMAAVLAMLHVPPATVLFDGGSFADV